LGSGSHGPFTSMIYHSWNGDFPQQTVKCLGTRHRAPFCWDELSLFWITPKKSSSKCVDHIIQLGITMEYHVALSETYLYNFIHNLWKYLFLMRVSSRFRMPKLIAFLQKEEPPTIDLGWPRHRASKPSLQRDCPVSTTADDAVDSDDIWRHLQGLKKRIFWRCPKSSDQLCFTQKICCNPAN